MNKQRCAFQTGFSFFGAMIDALARRVWGGICPPREKWRECEKHLPLPLSICSVYVCWPVVVICWSDRSSLWLQTLFLHPLMANCLVWRLVSYSGSVCDSKHLTAWNIIKRDIVILLFLPCYFLEVPLNCTGFFSPLYLQAKTMQRARGLLFLTWRCSITFSLNANPPFFLFALKLYN